MVFVVLPMQLNWFLNIVDNVAQNITTFNSRL